MSVREGIREEIGTFCELMLATCKRQAVKPLPSREGSIFALWDAAIAGQHIRLTFAEADGKILAGLVCILFGQTATFWKKGWSSSDGQRHPNEMLMSEGLNWASTNGFKTADFYAFDSAMASAILTGEPLTPEQENSRHVFHMRLGGAPKLLPKATTLIPNRLVRLAYRLILRQRLRQAGRTNQSAPRPASRVSVAAHL